MTYYFQKNSAFTFYLFRCYCSKIKCFSTYSIPGSNSVPTAKKKCNCITYRCFVNVPNFTDRKKEFYGRKLVGYSMDQMYSVVSDVKNYTNFVPFCKRSVILSERPDNLKADLVIGFPPILESYTSNVTLMRPNLVKAECTEGKLFSHLLTQWKFSPGLKSTAQSCIIDFSVSFEFKSVLHSQLAHLFFNGMVRQMEAAFLTEATVRFGKPAVRSKKLGLISDYN